MEKNGSTAQRFPAPAANKPGKPSVCFKARNAQLPRKRFTSTACARKSKAVGGAVRVTASTSRAPPETCNLSLRACAPPIKICQVGQENPLVQPFPGHDRALLKISPNSLKSCDRSARSGRNSQGNSIRRLIKSFGAISNETVSPETVASMSTLPRISVASARSGSRAQRNPT